MFSAWLGRKVSLCFNFGACAEMPKWIFETHSNTVYMQLVHSTRHNYFIDVGEINNNIYNNLFLYVSKNKKVMY